VKANQVKFPVRLMCRLLEVSASGFYAWDERPLSKRALEDIALSAKIHAIHRGSRESYGVPRIHAELADDYGIHVGRKRVARLMRAAGLRGVSRRRFVRTTVADIHAHLPPDLVDRNFQIDRLDRLWVADITYVPTWAGFLFLAIVLDACSRKVVGWAMENHLRTELVLAAINMALAQRRPDGGVIHHSDHGCQYTSFAFGKRCREMGVMPSVGSVGDAYDNAMAESFFATLECELLDRRSFQTQAEAKLAVFEFIEGFYNTRRRHSSLGYRSPVRFESELMATTPVNRELRAARVSSSGVMTSP
jgi:putative transposase